MLISHKDNDDKDRADDPSDRLADDDSVITEYIHKPLSNYHLKDHFEKAADKRCDL